MMDFGNEERKNSFSNNNNDVNVISNLEKMSDEEIINLIIKRKKEKEKPSHVFGAKIIETQFANENKIMLVSSNGNTFDSEIKV